MRRVCVLPWVVLTLSACAVGPPHGAPKLPSEAETQAILREELRKAVPPTPPIRAGGEEPVAPAPRDPLADSRATLRGVDLPLAEILIRLARPTGLTLVIEPEVNGQHQTNVNVQDLAVRDALRVVLAPFGYFFRVDRSEELVVYAFETRVWTLSLPPVEANWEQTVTNQAITGAEAQAGGAGPTTTTGSTTQTTTALSSVQLGSKITLTQKGVKISFWDDVTDALKRMVSGPGWYAINRVAGTVTVRERPDRLADIDRHFQSVEMEVGKQVQVEVKVLEVQLTSADTLGIDWQQVYSGLLDSGRAKLSLSFQNTARLLAGTTLPLSLIFRSGSEQAVIRALGQQGRVRTLSQPKVLISNNQAAIIQVGEVRSFVASLQTTLAGTGGISQTSASLGAVQDGVILGLTPRIYGQEVVMTVTPVLSKISQIRAIELGGGNRIEAPNINSRSLSTTVRIPSGGMAVLGGLLSEEDRTNEAGLPWLRKIPVLGWLLFGFHEQSAARSELVITLTPTIVSPLALVSTPPPPPPRAPAPAPPPSHERVPAKPGPSGERKTF